MNYGKAGPRELMVNGKSVGWFQATGDMETDLGLATERIRELGYAPPDLPQWMRIRQQAMDFRNACGLIMNYDNGRRPPDQRPLSAPYVVNTALCIELYLKALSLRHGTAQRGHDLCELYDRLPKDAKSAILCRVEEARAETNYPGQADDADLRAMFESMKDNFIQWRYLHEYERLGTLLMGQLFFLRALLHRSCLN